MASNPSDALIIWNPHSSGALVTTGETSRPNRGRWALILDAFQNPSPGRTLDEIYSTLGKVLEKQANRAAYALGLGPHAVGRKIKVYLEMVKNGCGNWSSCTTQSPRKLEKHCLKLMKYTLPAESANVQCQAFKGIVELTTLFPGLRFIFLSTKCLKNTPSIEAVSALCERSAGPPDDEWVFWQMLAATCLTDTTISAMLEKNSVSDLTNCSEEGLSVIERLLVEHDSSGASKYSSAACIRYLGGVLDLPGFWVDMGGVRSDVTNRLCRALIRILKDIGVDDLTLGPTNESGLPFDDEGVDFLATRILTGISSWFGKLDQKDWSMQLWHESFRDFLWLLRMPRAAELLPQSFAVATTTFEDILPTVNRIAQLSIFVDGENETEDTQNKIDNNSLADLHHQMIQWPAFTTKVRIGMTATALVLRKRAMVMRRAMTLILIPSRCQVRMRQIIQVLPMMRDTTPSDNW
ncbi:hypothetical protein B0H14DRAFT_1466384 [Mycena olivaceomarginata]|nr:hypothetical protein B0H14DRAFT_1466384 [Mycena olivaceomarginata]